MPDYLMGPHACALYISLQFHNLNPNHLATRIAALHKSFRLRVALCLCDIDDAEAPLLAINQLCARNDVTLLVAWTHQEAARYLETLRSYEKKPASGIQRACPI